MSRPGIEPVTSRSPERTLYQRSYRGWSYCFIISKYGVHISNRLQDIRQNHWTITYRSKRPTFILRSNVGSYKLIILKYEVHTANSLQDIRQNQWTMKYRSQRPTFILRSNVLNTRKYFLEVTLNFITTMVDITTT